MLGPEVLDVGTFPEIAFASTTIEPSGTDRWQVTGRLTIHGQGRTITFPVARLDGKYRGEVAIKQRDFGIRANQCGRRSRQGQRRAQSAIRNREVTAPAVTPTWRPRDHTSIDW